MLFKLNMMSRHCTKPVWSIHSTNTLWYQPLPTKGRRDKNDRLPGFKSTKEKSANSPSTAFSMLSYGLNTEKSWFEKASAFLRHLLCWDDNRQLTKPAADWCNCMIKPRFLLRGLWISGNQVGVVLEMTDVKFVEIAPIECPF